jgi:uncharacterized surface protein with fasciclin (FAS1) repeats
MHHPTELQERFEELCAGRAIGDLTADEARELAALCEQLGTSPNASLDLLAAAVQADAHEVSAETLPPQLAARFHQWADQSAPSNIVHPRVPAWRKLAVHPLTGWVAAAIVLLVSLVANRDPQPPPPQVKQEGPATTESFKTFAAALTAAGLVDSLQGKGPFTIFAPTDEAFARLPQGTVESMFKPENKEMLHQLIRHHVLPGEMPLARALASHAGATLQGSKINIHFDDGRVRIGESNLVKADIEAPNSTIHVIDRVLLPDSLKISDSFPGLVDLDSTGKIKTLEDIPGVTITRVPTRPRNSEPSTDMRELVTFLDGMQVKTER